MGEDFQNDLDNILSQHIPLLCNNLKGFINLVLKTFKEKSVEKMKSSSIVPRQLRIAMESAPINGNSGMLGRMKVLMIKPLEIAMMSPPILAACKVSNNTLIKVTVKKAIDQAFNAYCQEKNIEEEPALAAPAAPAPTALPVPTAPAALPAPAAPSIGGKRRKTKSNQKRNKRKTRRSLK